MNSSKDDKILEKVLEKCKQKHTCRDLIENDPQPQDCVYQELTIFEL